MDLFSFSKASANTQEISELSGQVTEKLGYGVLSGLVVSAQDTPDMTVKVSAGIAYGVDGTRFEVEAVASVTITAAHETYSRWDIIYLNSSGAVSYLAGIAAETPAIPATPTGGLKLCEINTVSGYGMIDASCINLNKHTIYAEPWVYPALQNGYLTGTNGRYARYKKGADGLVTMGGFVEEGIEEELLFALPEGYKPEFNYIFGELADWVAVNKDGTIYCSANATLDGISFYAAT